MGDVHAVELRAEVRQVKTMADHSFNVTLNLGEDCTEQVKVLLDWLMLNVAVVIANVSELGLDGKETGKGRRKRD